MTTRKKNGKEFQFHIQLTSSKVSLVWEDKGETDF